VTHHPRGHHCRRIVPVYCGSAFKNKGIQRMLDGVVALPARSRRHPPDHQARADEENQSAHPIRSEPFRPWPSRSCRQAHGQADLYPRLFRHVERRRHGADNSTQDANQRIGRILRMHANRQEAIEEAMPATSWRSSGSDTRTGDTLCCPTTRSCWSPSSSRRPSSRSASSPRAARQRQDGRGPASGWPTRIRPSSCITTRKPRRPLSPAWANCTSKCSSNA
jgi:translation elongation factor EF-G